MLSVFYDDRCKICSKEINFYKKIAPKNSLNWLGISSSKLDLKLANIKLVDALLYLHVKFLILVLNHLLQQGLLQAL